MLAGVWKINHLFKDCRALSNRRLLARPFAVSASNDLDSSRAQAATLRTKFQACTAVMPAVGTSAVEGKDAPVKQLKAILFDVDGTLADSDPLHYLAFREILLEVGFNNGQPITEEFFRQRISGRHNPDITADFFPDWNEKQRDDFTADKEQRFRRMALTELKEVDGLTSFCKWVEDQGLFRAAVTNAPRENAEQMIAGLGLADFFQHLVIGSECERAKPFPEPYLKGLELLGVTAEECIAIEDSPAGVRAALAAMLPTVGVLTGQTSETLLSAGTFITIRDYSDLDLRKYLQNRLPSSGARISEN